MSDARPATRGNLHGASGCPPTTLGYPRLHLRRTDSTNERARQLALAGAPHGTCVTASEQTAGRGRQGRSWIAPPGRALLCSVVLRDAPQLLSIIAGVAVCDVVGEQARLKWPNDVVIEAPDQHLAKLAGILVEGRPQEAWSVLGIGLNVALDPRELPLDVRGRAASLRRSPSAIEPLTNGLLQALQERLAEPLEDVLEAWRIRDALQGREISWGVPGKDGHRERDRSSRGQAQGLDRRDRPQHGQAQGLDGDGQLIVKYADGSTKTLSAGEIHLLPDG